MIKPAWPGLWFSFTAQQAGAGLCHLVSTAAEAWLTSLPSVKSVLARSHHFES